MHFGCLGVVFGWGGFIIAWIINSLAESQPHYYKALDKYWCIAKTINFISMINKRSMELINFRSIDLLLNAQILFFRICVFNICSI